MKFVMSLCVVLIHVDAICASTYNAYIQFVIQSAVPFFFIASGFLIGRKFTTSDDDYSICKQYSGKILRMYLFWIMVYTPIAVYELIINDGSIIVKLYTYARGVLLIGEIPYSWPLWFLLALLVSVFLIGIMRKMKIKMSIIWGIGIAFMAIGYWIDTIDINSLEGTEYLLCKAYNVIFGTTRNALFQGLGYVSTGILISKVRFTPPSLNKLIIFLCLISSVFLYYISFRYWTLLSGIALVWLSTTISLQNHNIFKVLRVHSQIIYFTHMFIIYALHKTDITSNIFSLSILALSMAFILSLLIHSLIKKRPLNFLQQFI